MSAIDPTSNECAAAAAIIAYHALELANLAKRHGFEELFNLLAMVVADAQALQKNSTRNSTT